MAIPVRKLVVHVGDIKSATTSVQVALAAGRQPEIAGRLLYPAHGLNHNYLEHPFKNGRGPDHPQIQWLRKRMIAAVRVDTCIISGERLSVMAPARLKAAIGTAFGDLAESVTIVHYIRPHADRMLSAYAERVKIGAERRALHDFLRDEIASGRFLQARRLKRWRAIFGDGYKLRAMVPGELIRGDAVVDFFDTVFGHVPEGWRPPTPTNESLSASGLSQVARLQNRMTDAPASLRHAVGYEFAWLYGREGGTARPDRIGMDPGMAAHFRDAFMADARMLDEDLFSGAELFVPALLAGTDKALTGNSRPLDLPADPVGEGIAEQLLGRVTTSRNHPGLARQMRDARYRRYIDAARSS